MSGWLGLFIVLTPHPTGLKYRVPSHPDHSGLLEPPAHLPTVPLVPLLVLAFPLGKASLISKNTQNLFLLALTALRKFLLI